MSRVAERESDVGDQRRLSVDVVIPAFNEAHSIARILTDVASSRIDPPCFLRRVDVWSDCSTDGTDEIVKEFATLDDRVGLERSCPRRGKSYMLNQAFRRSDAAVLVILDADVGLADRGTLSELVKPVVTEDAVLVGADVVPDRRGAREALPIASPAVVLQRLWASVGAEQRLRRKPAAAVRSG